MTTKEEAVRAADAIMSRHQPSITAGGYIFGFHPELDRLHGCQVCKNGWPCQTMKDVGTILNFIERR